VATTASELPRRLATRSAAVLRTAAVVVGVVIAALGIGVGSGVVAGRFGWPVLYAGPLLLVAGAVMLNRPAVAPAAVVVVAPVGLVEVAGGLKLAQLASAAVVAAVVFRRLAAGMRPLVWSPHLWWGAGVVVLALASTPHALDLGLAYRQDLALVLGVLLVAAVIASCSTLVDVRRNAEALVIVGGLTCLNGARDIGQLQAVAGGQVVRNRLHGTFTEPNQFGIFSAVVLLVAVGLFLGARTRGQQWRASLSGLAALTALGLTLSRGSWIGTAVGAGLLLALLPVARRRLLVLAVPLLVVAVGVAVLQPDRPEVQVLKDRVSTFGNVTGNPYDSRPQIWAEAARETLERPLLGQGPGQFPVVSTRSVSGAQTVSAVHAHDVLLTTSAEIGIPAALLVVGLTLSVLAGVRRAVHSAAALQDRALLAGLAAGASAVVGEGIVDFTLRNAVVMATLTVVLGLLLAALRLLAAPGAGEAPAGGSLPSSPEVRRW
jgi:O-antigen ligase